MELQKGETFSSGVSEDSDWQVHIPPDEATPSSVLRPELFEGLGDARAGEDHEGGAWSVGAFENREGE